MHPELKFYCQIYGSIKKQLVDKKIYKEDYLRKAMINRRVYWNNTPFYFQSHIIKALFFN
ncbi:hypothetical protein EV194_101264 [Natronoflexus pectinivorans]|uniref:Uncharacterized protein n=1 Tax=Natronoflexus pectinivorans TaxID=682526 RepID=A0A4R2GN15_9BACT|nr:hypothetical protein EV194_101264 [Natronoflexus pectinivorans]